jgi:hypothetical protein
VEFGVEGCSVCGLGREIDLFDHLRNGRLKNLVVRFVELLCVKVVILMQE